MDVGTLSIEGTGSFFPSSPGEDIDSRVQLHVHESSLGDSVKILSLQESSTDSSGPKVYFRLGLVGHLLVDHDVGQIHAAARLQNPEDFLET